MSNHQLISGSSQSTSQSAWAKRTTGRPTVIHLVNWARTKEESLARSAPQQTHFSLVRNGVCPIYIGLCFGAISRQHAKPVTLHRAQLSRSFPTDVVEEGGSERKRRTTNGGNSKFEGGVP